MEYLVTGGLGVVGSRFVETVATAGHRTTVLDAAEEPRNSWMAEHLLKIGSVRVIKERVERVDLVKLVMSHDMIVHAAAHTGIPHSAEDPEDDWASNVEASRKILEAMRKGQCSRPTVMLSSVKPYRLRDLPHHEEEDRTVWDDPEFQGVDEERPLDPDEPYAASKMAQSALATAYARTYGLPVTVLRCSNLYGDAPCHGPRHGWLTWFCIAAATGMEIQLQGSGRQTRDMLFSDDVATAVMAAFESMDEVRGKVFNIGGGRANSVSCIEAVQTIEKILGRSVRVRKAAGRTNEDMIFTTDHSRFTSATGWAPKIAVEEGICKILRWAERNAKELRAMYGA